MLTTFICGIVFGLALVSTYHFGGIVAAQMRMERKVKSARASRGTPLATGEVTPTGTVVLRATSNAELVNEIGYNFGNEG